MKRHERRSLAISVSILLLAYITLSANSAHSADCNLKTKSSFPKLLELVRPIEGGVQTDLYPSVLKISTDETNGCTVTKTLKTNRFISAKHCASLFKEKGANFSNSNGFKEKRKIESVFCRPTPREDFLHFAEGLVSKLELTLYKLTQKQEKNPKIGSKELCMVESEIILNALKKVSEEGNSEKLIEYQQKIAPFDLAVVEIKPDKDLTGFEKLPLMPIAETSIKKGEEVKPTGYADQKIIKSGSNRAVIDANQLILFASDPANPAPNAVGLQHGDSGGPVFNSKGEIAGIISGHVSQTVGDTRIKLNTAVNLGNEETKLWLQALP